MEGTYTWGLNSEGQLGLGHACVRSNPEMIGGSLAVVHARSVSCGDYHTAVLTDEGDTYTFGRGHEGQTGHGVRPSESVTLAPHYIKALQGVKMARIACGMDYTVAVSTKGDVYTWGAGGVGQLGTGRTTKRWRPEKVQFTDNGEENLFVDVAAGWGHVLASTAGGKLAAWGINTYGQLGVGDLKTRFYPQWVQIGGPESVEVKKPFARLHHSACLLTNGSLCTWGSAQGCLGQDAAEKRSICTPQLVKSISQQFLNHVNLSNNAMAVFAATSIKNISPSYGPSSGGTVIQLEGSGFWKHPIADIQVCFVAPDIPAQLVNGTLDECGTIITCVSPAWSDGQETEAGEDEYAPPDEESVDGLDEEEEPKIVTVELSINNVDYTTDRFSFEYYEQAKVMSVFPKAITCYGGTDVIISGENFADYPDIKVRFQEVEVPDGMLPRVIIVPGRRVRKDASTNVGDPASEEESTIQRSKAKGYDIVCSSPTFIDGSLPLRARISVALNGVDFTNEDVFLTIFDPTIAALKPNCAVATGGAIIQISGNGFLTGVVPKVKFMIGKYTKDILGECVSPQLIKCKVPPILLGATEEELAKKSKEFAKLKEADIEKKWTALASAQAPNHIEGSVQLTFNEKDYGPPVVFHTYLGTVASLTPNNGPLKGGTTLAYSSEGKWFFDSPSLGVKFENQKSDIVVPAKYDANNNVIKCTAPCLIPQELLQMSNMDAEIKQISENLSLEESDRKQQIDKIDKEKKNLMKNLPKLKVETSVTFNGVDFMQVKAGGTFSYTDPITALKIEPETVKTGDEITITGEGISNMKTTLIRFEHAKISQQVAGKYLKDKNGYSCKVPAIEYKSSVEQHKPDDIPVLVSLSFNDGNDWSVEGLLKYKV